MNYIVKERYSDGVNIVIFTKIEMAVDFVINIIKKYGVSITEEEFIKDMYWEDDESGYYICIIEAEFGEVMSII